MYNFADACARLDADGNRQNIERDKSVISREFKVQYIPKKSHFSDFTREQVERIQDKRNERPRKKSGYKTPNKVFFLALQPQLYLRVKSSIT